MITNTRAAAPSSVGIIRSTRFVTYVDISRYLDPAQSSASQTSWSFWLA